MYMYMLSSRFLHSFPRVQFARTPQLRIEDPIMVVQIHRLLNGGDGETGGEDVVTITLRGLACNTHALSARIAATSIHFVHSANVIMTHIITR